MKRYCTFIMILVMLLSMAACGKENTAEAPVAVPASDTMAAADTVPAADAAPAAPAEPADDLSALREDMKPPVMAVADFGFPELTADFSVMDYLLEEFPQWMTEQDYIRNIPEERIIQIGDENSWSNLVCIVPRDPESSVTVEVMVYLEREPYMKNSVVYYSESGDPLLLLADISESAVVSVTVTDSDGRGVSWQPYWETAVPVPDADYRGHLVMYYSPQSEKTPYGQAASQDWQQPELSQLMNTFWLSWNGYALELNEDAVPADTAGDACLYDVGEIGEYTLSYTGSWRYEDGMLHLSLVPKFGDGYLVDDSFPVLMQDGMLWIGRNEYGNALPHFYADQLADTLEQPKG